jgi:hypothetical protein
MKKKIIKQLYRNALPTILQQKIDVMRGESQVFRPCFAPSQSIFIHIPKAAGTSIARAIYGMNVGHKKIEDYARVSQKELDKYFTYSFVRNPWDRTVSAYNFFRQNGTKYVQPLKNDIFKSEQFSTFERFVLEWLIEADLSQEDVIFAPQHWYIRNKKRDIAVDYLGKVEQLDLGIAEIGERLNIDIKLEKLNSSKRKEEYRNYYSTPELIDIVAQIYAKDIELFDYTF